MPTFQQILDTTNGKTLSFQQNTSINNFIFDSRITFNPTSSIFIAIGGKNHDGHNFIEELSKKGVKNFIVEKEITPPPNSNVILVKNSIEALQKIATNHRNLFSIPVIGITGSNGKTIIKEWLGQALSQKFRLVKSPKSYNSQLGVPISVLQLEESTEMAIFEAGISMREEMQRLQKIIQPTIGIFTNIGSAHDKGFLSRDEKLLEKWRLFENAEYVVYCKDHIEIDQSKPENIKSFTWGKSVEADILLLSVQKENTGSTIKIIYQNKEFSINLPFKEQAYIENALHVISTCLSLGLSIEFIQSSLLLLRKVAMRLEIKEGINQCILIDDTYNNDLAGFTSAVEFLTNQNLGKKKTIIISELISSGIDGQYDELLNIIRTNGIERLIGVGEQLKTYCSGLEIEKQFYPSTKELLADIDQIKFSDEAILIKGARPFAFEKITQKLSKKIHGTKLEINLNALTNNLNYYKSLLEPGVKLMVMVKAFGYGSGSVEIANLLEFHKVDYLAVAYPDEGVELRQQGISIPIMVMNVSKDAFGKLVDYRLEPEVISFQQLNELTQFIRETNQPIPVHIKIDTGMKRLGFELDEIDRLIDQINETNIQVASIFTHLAGADEDIHTGFSLQQLSTFECITQKIIDGIEYKPILHALNSPGIIRFPSHQFDMVRLGIGLYGYESCGIKQDKLEPISELKSEISQIRKIKAGETVGYGRKGVAEKDTTVATIAIGYADGFNRAFSNGTISVNINGHRAPVIGNVCMDMTMVDVSDIPAEVGDEVIIFGKDPTIQELANAIGTIPYEILTNVSERVKRVYHSE